MDQGIHYGYDVGNYHTNRSTDHVKLVDLKQPHLIASSMYPGDAHINLGGYLDSDYANNADDRRSVAGYIFVFSGAPLAWNAMTQHPVALSTIEAEYYAVYKAIQTAIYRRMMLEETGTLVNTSLVICENNQACISFS